VTTTKSDSDITCIRSSGVPRCSRPMASASSSSLLRFTASTSIPMHWSILPTSRPMLPKPTMPAFLPLRRTPRPTPLPSMKVPCLWITFFASANTRDTAPSARGTGFEPEVFAINVSSSRASKGMSSTPAPVFCSSFSLGAARATSGLSLVATMTSTSPANLASSSSVPVTGLTTSTSSGRWSLILSARLGFTTRTFKASQRDMGIATLIPPPGSPVSPGPGLQHGGFNICVGFTITGIPQIAALV